VLALVGCTTFQSGPRLSTHGVSEARVQRWMAEVESKSGQRFGDTRITVHVVKTAGTAWSATFRRPVAIFPEGICGQASGSKKSVLVKLAETADGFLPDGYGVHEMAHAIRLSTTGSSTLPLEWKAWILGWHP